jgi:hypothetical protein
LLHLRTPYPAFDIDWLGGVASDLAGRDIFFDQSTWRPYGALWFAVLHAVYRNGQVAVFFTPNPPSDFESLGLPGWCRDVAWLLLDCDDRVRRERLRTRLEWTAAMVEEAIADARVLRQVVATRVDTVEHTPTEVASTILAWIEALKSGAWENACDTK